MPKKKKIRKEFYNEDDVRDLNKKGVKRERKKAQRHHNKNDLKDLYTGPDVDYDSIDEYMDRLDD